MARPQQRTARKDYPQQGIAKGDTYWFCQIKTGPRSSRTLRQKTPFKRSQLTSSDYLSQLYDWEDGKAEIGEMDSAQEFADTIRSLGEEQGEKFDNMPEGLQQGQTGEMLEARRDACEQAAEEIEEIISEWEDAKTSWETEIETYREEYAAYEESQAAFDEWEAAEDDSLPEPTVEVEPDLPEHTTDNGDNAYEFDESEWLDRVKEVSVED